MSSSRSHPAGSGWGPRSLGPRRLVPILLPSPTRGLGASSDLSAGLTAARPLRPLALLPLLWVDDHAWLPACGALDGLRGCGTDRARAGGAATPPPGRAALLPPTPQSVHFLTHLCPVPSGGPVPDCAPDWATGHAPRAAHQELPSAAASRRTHGLGLLRSFHPSRSPAPCLSPGPRSGDSAGPGAQPVARAGPLGSRLRPLSTINDAQSDLGLMCLVVCVGGGRVLGPLP